MTVQKYVSAILNTLDHSNLFKNIQNNSTNAFLKAGIDQMLHYNHLLFQWSFCYGIQPHCWKLLHNGFFKCIYIQYGSQNVISLYLEAQMELEAHIWQFRSTHKYFKSCEYELLTPSELRDTAI